MRAIRSISVILLTSLCSGCLTTNELERIKYHADNMEVRLAAAPDGRRSLQWQSLPGYTGEIAIRQGCRYFTPTRWRFAWTKRELVEIGDSFVRVYEQNPYDRTMRLPETFDGSGAACRFLVYGDAGCTSEICAHPFTIHVVESSGLLSETHTLPPREGIPPGELPTLALDVIIDIPLTAFVAAGIAVVAVVAVLTYPLVAAEKLTTPALDKLFRPEKPAAASQDIPASAELGRALENPPVLPERLELLFPAAGSSCTPAVP